MFGVWCLAFGVVVITRRGFFVIAGCINSRALCTISRRFAHSLCTLPPRIRPLNYARGHHQRTLTRLMAMCLWGDIFSCNICSYSSITSPTAVRIMLNRSLLPRGYACAISVNVAVDLLRSTSSFIIPRAKKRRPPP